MSSAATVKSTHFFRPRDALSPHADGPGALGHGRQCHAPRPRVLGKRGDTLPRPAASKQDKRVLTERGQSDA